MDISKKELIVIFFVNFVLLLIIAACLIVLECSFVALCLGIISVMFILLSSIMSWYTMKQKRIDVENE